MKTREHRHLLRIPLESRAGAEDEDGAMSRCNTMKSDAARGVTFQVDKMHASAAATPSHQPQVRTAPRLEEAIPA